MPAGSRLVVREVASDIQLDAQITFSDYSLGMRTRMGGLPGRAVQVASF
jgi:hypothetical protein